MTEEGLSGQSLLHSVPVMSPSLTLRGLSAVFDTAEHKPPTFILS